MRFARSAGERAGRGVRRTDGVIRRAAQRSGLQKDKLRCKRGDLDAAEKAFREVLKIDPNSAAASANLGVIAMQTQELGCGAEGLAEEPRNCHHG